MHVCHGRQKFQDFLFSFTSFQLHSIYTTQPQAPKTSTAGYPELNLNCINNVKEIHKMKYCSIINIMPQEVFEQDVLGHVFEAKRTQPRLKVTPIGSTPTHTPVATLTLQRSHGQLQEPNHPPHNPIPTQRIAILE